MSNSHAQHGVVVPAWDTVAVKATLKPSMGVAPQGKSLKQLRKFPKLFYFYDYRVNCRAIGQA